MDELLDEEALLAGLKTGDPAFFEQLVRRNIPWMLGLARRLLKDEALAEDCVQEAFVSAFKSLDKFEGRAALKSWLHRITVNAALMKLRARKRLSEDSIDALMPEFDGYGCRIEVPWSLLARPDEIVERENLREFVISKINELPDTYRVVLHLRDIEDLEVAEIADHLDISVGAAKVRIHRARSALKKLLEPLLRGEAGL